MVDEMKSAIHIKKINKKECWYKDTPYHDKEKKQLATSQGTREKT